MAIKNSSIFSIDCNECIFCFGVIRSAITRCINETEKLC